LDAIVGAVRHPDIAARGDGDIERFAELAIAAADDADPAFVPGGGGADTRVSFLIHFAADHEQKLAIGGELLDAVVVAIGYPEVAFGIDVESPRRVHLAFAGAGRAERKHEVVRWGSRSKS
jgi:hypothetical protein